MEFNIQKIPSKTRTENTGDELLAIANAKGQINILDVAMDSPPTAQEGGKEEQRRREKC